MATEHLHHAGEDARLNHTQEDLRFWHFIRWTEVLVVLSAVVFLAVAALLVILL